MENTLKDRILEEVDDLVKDIKLSPSYQRYQKITEKMKQNESLMAFIQEYKTTQQQLVKAEYQKQKDKKQELEAKLNSLSHELNQIPLYVEYLNIQEELNTMFGQIKTFFEDYFDHILNQS